MEENYLFCSNCGEFMSRNSISRSEEDCPECNGYESYPGGDDDYYFA